MKSRLFLILVVLLAVFTGCKQQLNITAPNYQEIPVIYGFLSQQDNPHYIRIQKGYLLQGSAYLAAGNIDSIYYPDVLTVQLMALNNGNVTQTFNLHRVDGNTVGIPQGTGVFANTPNYLYTFTGNISPQYSYMLYDSNRTSGKVATATISLISNFNLSSPIPGFHYDLSNTTPGPVFWNSPPNADVYDVTIRFFYQEFATGSNTLLKDTFIDIPLVQSLISPYVAATTVNVKFTEDNIVRYLASHLTSSPNVYRRFNDSKGMQFKVAAGGIEFANFLNAEQAQSGLASSNTLPTYTNINGGLGLFTARYYSEVDSVLLSPSGLDSLACGSDAGGLHFMGNSGQICN